MRTIIENGVEIKLTEKEFRQYEAERKKKLEEAQAKMHEFDLKELRDANEVLNQKVLKCWQKEKSPIKQKVLKELIKNFSTKEDLEYRTWLYNDGKLRSTWEVEDYKTNHKKELYRNSTNFNTSSKMTNTICFLIPFTLCIAIVMSKPDAKTLWFLYLPIAVLIACFFSFISMMFGYSLNIGRGKRKGLTDSDPRLINEKAKRSIGALGGFVAGASTYRHTKRSVKEFLNVDSWEEFK